MCIRDRQCMLCRGEAAACKATPAVREDTPPDRHGPGKGAMCVHFLHLPAYLLACISSSMKLASHVCILQEAEKR
eukprot:3807057-Prorocentrum_lima.AAC.1